MNQDGGNGFDVPAGDEFVRFVFRGKRFETHELPVAVLPSLTALEKLLRLVAAAKYRKQHELPSAPRGFLSEFRLILAYRGEGSTVTGCVAHLPKKDAGHYDQSLSDAGQWLNSAQNEAEAASLSEEMLLQLVRMTEVLDEDESLSIHQRGGRQLVAVTRKAHDTLKGWRSTPTVRRERGLLGKIVGGRHQEYFEVDVPRYGKLVKFKAFREDDWPTITTAMSNPNKFEVRIDAVVDEDLSDIPTEGIMAHHIEFVDGPELYTRLEHLAGLADGWYDGQGYGITENTMQRARKLLFRLLENVRGLSRPRLYPTFQGGVQMEWSVGTAELEIDVQPEGGVETAVTIGEHDESDFFLPGEEDDLHHWASGKFHELIRGKR